MRSLIKYLTNHVTFLQLSSSFLCAVSILLTLLLNPEPINPDGLLYLQASQAYLSDGLKASLAIFSWPLISLTFATLHQLTHLSLERSAYLANLIFSFFFVWNFIGITRRLAPTNKRFLLASCLIIVLYPELNRDAMMITRDIAYWAFSSYALLSLLRYSQKPRWLTAILFGLAQGIATLYRAEGLVIWLLLPFALLFIRTLKYPLWQIIRSQVILLILTFLALLFIAELPTEQVSDQLQRIIAPLTHFHTSWIENWQEKISHLNDYVLTPNAKGNGITLLWGGSLAVIAVAIFKSLSGFYCLLAAYGLRVYRHPRHERLIPLYHPLLLGFFFINLAIITGVAFQHQFLMSRYVVPCAWLLLLFSAYGLSHLPKRFPFTLIVSLCFIAVLITNLKHTGHSKQYIISAGTWLKNHAESKTIFSNAPQIIYYAGRSVDYKHNPFTQEQFLALSKNKGLSKFDYVVYVKTHDEIAAPFNQLPIAVFENSRHDAALIYKMYSGNK